MEDDGHFHNPCHFTSKN